MQETKQLRIGLLGASRIAPMAVIDPARQLPGVSVDVIAARDRERASAYAAEHRIPRTSENYASLVEDPEIDLVYNALPPSGHAALTIHALQAGKHVLCEKPLAMNVAQAEEMIAASNASEGRLIEAFHYRYHPAFDHCLALLAAGEIGTLRAIEAAFDVAIAYAPTELRHHRETGGGAMMDLGCYPLNWALMVAGQSPAEITAVAQVTPQGVDETMRATLEFPSGVRADIRCSMAKGAAFRAEMILRGSAGILHFRNPLSPHDGGYISWENSRGTRRIDADPTPTYEWQLAAVLQGLQEGTALPTEGAALLEQQRALDRIYRAAGLGALRETA